MCFSAEVAGRRLTRENMPVKIGSRYLRRIPCNTYSGGDVLMIRICLLAAEDVPAVRRLQRIAPDPHSGSILQQFPRYFEAISILDPGPKYFARNVYVVGAIFDEQIVGTVALMQMPEPEFTLQTSEADSAAFWESFSEEEARQYERHAYSHFETVIGAPPGSFLVHSLHVSPEFQRRGIAERLLRFLIDQLQPGQVDELYIEIARGVPLNSLLHRLGFVPIKDTHSAVEHSRYGVWGSILLKYKSLAKA